MHYINTIVHLHVTVYCVFTLWPSINSHDINTRLSTYFCVGR